MDERIQHLFTERVLELKQRIEELEPENNIEFQVMTDPQLIRESAGGAVQTNSDGKETLLLDPSRATELITAHELMHIILHRSHWPQMYSIFMPEDALALNIANTLDNILDHYIFDPMLLAQGYDLSEYRDWYIDQLKLWPQHEQTEPGLVLHDSLMILDALLFGQDYRRKAIGIIGKDHSKSLGLAYKLEELVDPKGERTQKAVRQSLIKMLRFVDKWLSAQTHSQTNLLDRIGVSPFFTAKRLLLPAANTIGYKSYAGRYDNYQLWVGAFNQKSDNIRFRNMIMADVYTEPPEISAAINQLKKLSLGGFLVAQRVTKYTLDDPDQ